MYLGGFPIPIDLSQDEKAKCRNQELKSAGKFFVTKTVTKIFKVVLRIDDDRKIASLNADSAGICDDVRTTTDFQGCGLAKYLVATCFQDISVIGTDRVGVDINNHGYWKPKARKKQRNNALKYCQTITFLRCMPHNGAPHAVCVSYLRAGSMSEFDLVLTTPLLEFISTKAKPFNVFKLGPTLENKFKGKAENFLKSMDLLGSSANAKKKRERIA